MISDESIELIETLIKEARICPADLEATKIVIKFQKLVLELEALKVSKLRGSDAIHDI